MTRYSDNPLVGDPAMVKDANRRFDQQTGFNQEAAGAGCPRLQYPPYLPALPGYAPPRRGMESEAMSAAIQEWNQRWVEARLASGLG